MGYTQTEKENYKDFGYHNYQEFIDDFDNLLIQEYGKDHNLSYTKEPKSYTQARYKRKLTNHLFTFDISKDENVMQKIGQFSKNGIIRSDGREMFEMWKATGDFEECIIFAEG